MNYISKVGQPRKLVAMRTFITVVAIIALVFHVVVGCCAHHVHADCGGSHAAANAADDHAGHCHHKHKPHSSQNEEPKRDTTCDEPPCVFTGVSKLQFTPDLASVFCLFASSAVPSAQSMVVFGVERIDQSDHITLPVRIHLWNQVLLT